MTEAADVRTSTPAKKEALSDQAKKEEAARRAQVCTTTVGELETIHAKLVAYHEAVVKAIDFLSGISLPGSPNVSRKQKDIIRLLMEAERGKSKASR